MPRTLASTQTPESTPLPFHGDPGLPAAMAPTPAKPVHPPLRWSSLLLVLLLLLAFLEGITLMGLGFKTFGKPFAVALMHATASPVLGLLVGLLATSIIQSSSCTTSIVVGLVASGSLPIGAAIPVVMGANIGTTVTNTLVSLGSMGRKDEFRRAFAAATVHDYFNIASVLLLLPLECATGYLERISRCLAGLMEGSAGGTHIPNPIEMMLRPPAAWVIGALEGLGLSLQAAGAVAAALGLLVVVAALILLVRTLRSLMMDRLESFFERLIGRSWPLAMLLGILLTTAVQSSSITTSLLVPMAGAGLLTLEQVYPVTLGANVGTTVTALLASLAAPAGLQIALVHLLFNVTGIALLYPAPPVRRVVLGLARALARAAAERRRWAVFYILVVFFGIPGLLLLVTGTLG